MNLVFTTAAPGQLAEVDRLIRSAFTPYVRALGREIAADAYGWFGDAIGQGDVYVALEGTEIVGAVATRRHGDDLELALIGVSPTRQKSGIASGMLAEIERVARTRGLRTLSLNTAEMMEDRVRLYGRHGFRIVRRGPPEHGKDAHVRVYMEKALRQEGPMIEINGMAHVILTVSDWEKSRVFYAELLPFLGLKKVYDGNNFLYHVGGRTALGIQRCAEEHAGQRFVPNRIGLHHLCLRARSREDVDRVAQKLKSMGAVIDRGPLEGDWAPGYYYIVFEDPDGIRLEVNYIPGRGLLATDPPINPSSDRNWDQNPPPRF